MSDPFEIPAFLDRRGEPRKKVEIPKRKWIMPDPKRLARIRRDEERQRRRIKAAMAKDLAGIEKLAATVDQVVDIQRKVR